MDSGYESKTKPEEADLYRQGGLENDLEKWLDKLGIRFNPFASQFLDAGADPRLPFYLVGHKDFSLLWGDWPSFVFASAGGGKSAFRVRLARACRVRQEGRFIFPIIYKLPSPTTLQQQSSLLAAHYAGLCSAAAIELLFHLAYQPWRYFKLTEAEQKQLRLLLETTLTNFLNHLLAQLEQAGDLSPLTEMFDPTATQLTSPPSPTELRQFCLHLSQITVGPTLPDIEPAIRFNNIIHFIKNNLAFEAIYILVDGVDAYQETVNDPSLAYRLIDPLLHQLENWAARSIYLKFFLPLELQPLIAKSLQSLTTSVKCVTIEWAKQTLVEMLQARLRAASDGSFVSFDALSTPDLYQIETKLVDVAKPLPREVLVLAERLFVEHIRRVGPEDKLGPDDFKAAQTWYKSQV